MAKAIKVENLSKAYQIGEFSTGTISRDIERWWALARGKEDPFLKIGETNVRSEKGTSNVIWSLKDLNFEIEQGEAIGIIGKNGAGKSTLLKVLSQVTTPTTGTIKMKGRVASLLEVGTGFHPELTGRENIYLNGAILGMTKGEVKKKFDEIVDFSGLERYIDTPVKRYSSGMYVRLAFAVAAFLESEILIVDEVLAVGDAEFRHKCLGKMSEVSKTGRTVLFVSHDMSSVSSLCNKGILIKDGSIVKQGSSDEVIGEYLSVIGKEMTSQYWDENERIGDEVTDLVSIKLIDKNFKPIQMALLGEKFGVEIVYKLKKDGVRINPGVTVYSALGPILCVSFPESAKIPTHKGIYKAVCWFPPSLFNNEVYSLRINAHTFYPTKMHFDLPDALSFEVVERNNKDRKIDYFDKLYGVIRPDFLWDIENMK